MFDPSLLPTRRRLLAGLALASGSALAPRAFAVGVASAGEQDAVARRLNLAGFQRTLSQQILVGATYARLGIEETRHIEQVAAASARFDAVLKGLRNGSEDLGLAAATAPRVLESLESVEALWQPLRAAARSIVEAGAVPDDAFDTVDSLSGPLLSTTDNVVTQLIGVYGASEIAIGTAISINVAGRQRTRIQEIAADIGLVAMERDEDRALRDLASDAELLTDSLEALIDGLAEITLPPPPDHIRLRLLEVRSRWESYERMVQRVIEAREAGPADLFTAAAQTNPLMAAIDEVVDLYGASV